MKHFTLQALEKMVMARPRLAVDQRPKPMPGKKWPTHVAWSLQLVEYRVSIKNGRVEKRASIYHRLHYVGKPSLYRALQARKFAAQGRNKASVYTFEMWQAEFDRTGLVAYKIYRDGKILAQTSAGAFWAYHPHSTQVDILEAFSRPWHLKYLGGVRVYSQKARLTQEAIDAYYDWYYQQFKRRLRRPKAIATAIIGGQNVETPVQP